MPPNFENEQRFREAIRMIDEENALDPNIKMIEGRPEPGELVYSQWLTGWVLRLQPNASEPLRLAARGQHISRWTIPRESYPKDRAGYLRWRAALKQFHAEKAAAILTKAGYSEQEISRVQSLVVKKNFPQDAETRVLEDALCLVFLERQLSDLMLKTSEDKLINALQKSWSKMSPDGQAHALRLRLGEKETSLLREALKDRIAPEASSD